MQNKGEIILYQAPDESSKIEVTLVDETVWLSLDQIAELFQRNKSTISRHIRKIFKSGELQEMSTIAFFATVQSEGNRSVERTIAFYNLDMIISVGYRVNSYRGVQFRMWVTSILKEHLIKGFAMNDELLKQAGGGNYFDELLSRIRDIRSSEKVFYRKVLEIYALSIEEEQKKLQRNEQIQHADLSRCAISIMNKKVRIPADYNYIKKASPKRGTRILSFGI